MHRFKIKSRQGGKNAEKPSKKNRKNKKPTLAKGLTPPLNITPPADDENNNAGKKPLPKIPDSKLPLPPNVNNYSNSTRERPYEDVNFGSTEIYDDVRGQQEYHSSEYSDADEEGVYEMTTVPPRRNTGFSEPDPEIYSHLDSGAGAASSSNYDCLRYDSKIVTNEAIYDSYPDMKGGQSSTENDEDIDDGSYAPVMFRQQSQDDVRSNDSDVTALSKDLSNLSHEESIYEGQIPRKFSQGYTYEVQDKNFVHSDVTASRSEDSYSDVSSDGYDVTPPSVDNEVQSTESHTNGNYVTAFNRFSQSDDVMIPPEMLTNAVFCEEAIYTARPPPIPSNNFNDSFESSENGAEYHEEHFAKSDVTEYDDDVTTTYNDVNNFNMVEESTYVVNSMSPAISNHETNMAETEDIYEVAGDISHVITRNVIRTAEAPRLPTKLHRSVNNDVTGRGGVEPTSPSACDSYETEDVYEVARNSGDGAREGVPMHAVHSVPTTAYVSDVTVTESEDAYVVSSNCNDSVSSRKTVHDRPTSLVAYNSDVTGEETANVYDVARHFGNVTKSRNTTDAATTSENVYNVAAAFNSDVTVNESADVYDVARHFGEVTGGGEARAVHRTSSAEYNTDVTTQSSYNSDVTAAERVDIYEMARDFNKVAARRRPPPPPPMQHRAVFRTLSSPSGSDVTATEDIYDVARDLSDVTTSNFKKVRELPSVPRRRLYLENSDVPTSGRLPLPVATANRAPFVAMSTNVTAPQTEDIYDVARDLSPVPITHFKNTSDGPRVPPRQALNDVTTGHVTNRLTKHTPRHSYHDITIHLNEEPIAEPLKLQKKPLSPKKFTNYGVRMNRKSRDQRKVSPHKIRVDDGAQFEVSKTPLTRKKSSLVQSTRISVAEAINFFKKSEAASAPRTKTRQANSRREAGRVTKLRNTANRPTTEEKQDVSARINVYNSSSGVPPPPPRKRKPPPPPKPRKSTREKKKSSELANSPLFTMQQKKLNT